MKTAIATVEYSYGDYHVLFSDNTWEEYSYKALSDSGIWRIEDGKIRLISVDEHSGVESYFTGTTARDIIKRYEEYIATTMEQTLLTD